MTGYRSMLLAAALTAAGLSGPADGANDKQAPEAGAAQKDYAAELPRTPPKDPTDRLYIPELRRAEAGQSGLRRARVDA